MGESTGLGTLFRCRAQVLSVPRYPRGKRLELYEPVRLMACRFDKIRLRADSGYRQAVRGCQRLSRPVKGCQRLSRAQVCAMNQSFGVGPGAEAGAGRACLWSCAQSLLLCVMALQ